MKEGGEPERLGDLRGLLSAEAPTEVDLTDPGHEAWVTSAADRSDAQSTTTDLEPYLDMVGMVVRFYRKYLPANAVADGFAQFIESLDQEAFDRLLEDLPGSIAEVDPATFVERWPQAAVTRRAQRGCGHMRRLSSSP